MTKQCSDCVFVVSSGGATPSYYCHHDAPVPYQPASVGSSNWPQVQATDWCGEGYNDTDGWYITIARPRSGGWR